jgi:dihydroorotate dehydrogenase
MSFIPYALARPFLFSLKPETAHELTLKMLSATQGTPWQMAYRASRVTDPIEMAGLSFPNRVGLAAGLDKNARCIDGLGALGFGFVELGTVTPLAQVGNPKPRFFRLPQAQALINRLGFNNDGLAAFIANLKRSVWYRQRLRTDTPLSIKKLPMLVGLNIGKNAATPIKRAIDDYLICLDGVYPYADYITLNISSPNTKDLRTLQNDAALDDLLGAVAQRRAVLAERYDQSKGRSNESARQVPIFVKIAPDLDLAQIKLIAAALLRHGIDGVIATNTTLSRDAVQGQTHFDETGGLSGAPLLDMSNCVITQLRAALGRSFPIIGVGGIMSAADALSKIRAGADVVQIYTGLIYQGPALVTQAANLIRQNR